MSYGRLIVLLILTLVFQSSKPADTFEGPFSGTFIPAGIGIKKALDPNTAPVRAEQPWTIYCWIRTSTADVKTALVAGFGDPAAAAGAKRFLAFRDGKLVVWAGDAEVPSDALIAHDRWQFLAATYTGGNITLYSDGIPVVSQPVTLLPAEPSVYLAPLVFPWTGATHFAGNIAQFTVVPRALSGDEIHALNSDPGKLDLTPFEIASKSWPVQIKGQDGLRAPQDAITLPRSAPPVSGNPVTRTPDQSSAMLAPRGSNEWTLRGGWKLTEAPKVNADGNAISVAGFDPSGWMNATVPGTVLTTMIDRGIYPDPDFGLNNFLIPESLNKQDYWYRTEFTPAAALAGRRLSITLHGINYAAEVWVNGKRLGEVRGAFIRGEFDVTALVTVGKRNAIAIRVSPPPHPGIPHEQSIKAGPGPNGGIMCLDGPTFICSEGWDWIPGIRDRDTGIWQDVTLKATGPVKLGDVHVITRLPLPDLTHAGITITIPMRNNSTRAETGVLEVAFEGVRIRNRMLLSPGQQEITLSPADFAELNLTNPRLWWPNGYGSAELYHLTVKFINASGVSDVASLRFGIRELSYELTLLDHEGHTRRVEFTPSEAGNGKHIINLSHEGMVQTSEGWVPSFMPGGEKSVAIRPVVDRRTSPFLVIRVNGVRIACKGGNWGMDDSRKRVSRERLEPYFRLHHDANLTMIRNWCGQNTEEVFFDLADEYGLLVWNDFWLSTQDWNLEPADPALFLANARDVLLRFRNHPSIAIWCGRNEGVPPPLINEGLDKLIRTIDGTRYYSPNSRMINLQDSGPWVYGDPASFFTRRGKGFSTELGLPSPPSLDTIKAMLPEADQWPQNDVWAYHDWHSKSGGEVTAFLKAMDDELGPATSLEDFDRKAQLLNYVSHRAMFEGFNSHLWDPNSGRLMWMTHPAWPSMEWQMYSSDYATHGAFYGVKRACEPLHVQLNLPDLNAAIINNTRTDRTLGLTSRVFSLNGQEIAVQRRSINAPAGTAVESVRVEIPPQAASGVVFVKLELVDEKGNLVSENFYWYAAEKSGYKKLNDMAAAAVECSAELNSKTEPGRVRVTITNPGPGIALAVQATVRHASDRKPILPAYFSDNFISLLPGEQRRITVDIPVELVGGELQVSLAGWNLRSSTVSVQKR